jgi:voltage-gated potassium channel
MEPAARPRGAPERSVPYQLFILVLTLFSLMIMGLLFLNALGLPLSQTTLDLLNFEDNVVAVIFLVDFTRNVLQAESKRTYFVDERGWLDLIGSIPTFGISQIGVKFGSLLRLARLSRLARIARLFRGNARQMLVDELIRNRGQYAAFITIMAACVVIVLAADAVLQFESTSADANITSAGDAFWWAVVTITTVGYGDHYPVTSLGRLTAAGVMFAGVGIIGSLASILASFLVPSPKEQAEAVAAQAAASGAPVATATAGGEGAPVSADEAALAREIAGMRDELAALRQELSATRGALGGEVGPTPVG